MKNRMSCWLIEFILEDGTIYYWHDEGWRSNVHNATRFDLDSARRMLINGFDDDDPGVGKIQINEHYFTEMKG